MSDTPAIGPSPQTVMEEARAAVREAGVPRHRVAVPIRLFESPEVEVERAIQPPWPRWMKRLYELERLGDVEVGREHEEVPLGAAVRAVSSRMHKRLEMIAWVVSALQESGWECVVASGHVVAWRDLDELTAREDLEREGIYGPMTHISILDERGVPLILTAD
jgi:hypothetical protein